MHNAEQVVDFEVAVSVLSCMLGLNNRAQHEEKWVKAQPDAKKLKLLDEEHARLWEERHNLRIKDRCETERVLREYGPKVKKELRLA